MTIPANYRFTLFLENLNVKFSRVLRNVFFFIYKKRSYYPIDYTCIDEIEFWIIDEDEPGELDLEEMENLLYEEGFLSIEVECSSLPSRIG